MKHLVTKARPTISVPFLDDTVEVVQLSVTEVRDFQKELNKQKDKLGTDEDASLAVQRKLIRLGVVGASELTDKELDSFPLKALSDLAKVVLEKAGVGEGNVE